MELEITATIYIDIDEIIERYELSYLSTDKEIMEAINETINHMDDADYYLIGTDEIEDIFNEIRHHRLGTQLSLAL